MTRSGRWALLFAATLLLILAAVAALWTSPDQPQGRTPPTTVELVPLPPQQGPSTGEWSDAPVEAWCPEDMDCGECSPNAVRTCTPVIDLPGGQTGLGSAGPSSGLGGPAPPPDA